MINSLKIKVKMTELGLTQKDLAIELSIAEPTVSLKINNKRPMSLDEAEIVSRVLRIDVSQFGDYFFSSMIA